MCQYAGFPRVVWRFLFDVIAWAKKGGGEIEERDRDRQREREREREGEREGDRGERKIERREERGREGARVIERHID